MERKSKEPNSLNSFTESGNGGFSLIELLVGISVLAVVGLMITSLFSSSTRLYRSTASYSNIQTESQAVSRKISNAIMGAGSLYLNEGERGSYLFTGEVKTEAGKNVYSGEIFWFNKETGCLYQNSGFKAEQDINSGPDIAGGESHDETGDKISGNPGVLSLETVRAALEENAGNGREYLISDKVKKLDFTIFPELTENERINEDDGFYKTDGKISVNFALTFQYLDSKSYFVTTSAAPRNRIAVLWWNGETGTGGGPETGA